MNLPTHAAGLPLVERNEQIEKVHLHEYHKVMHTSDSPAIL